MVILIQAFLRKLDFCDPTLCVYFAVVLPLTTIEMLILSKFEATVEGL